MPVAPTDAHDKTLDSGPDSQAAAAVETTKKNGLLTSILAYGAIVSSRLIIRIGKFQLAHKVAQSWPTRGETKEDFEYAKGLVGAIDRSSRYTTTKSWCLQRSLAAVLLLRFHGVPAQLIIGVRRVPFYAHAWAEVAGRVVNDTQAVQQQYAVIDQC